MLQVVMKLNLAVSFLADVVLTASCSRWRSEVLLEPIKDGSVRASQVSAPPWSTCHLI